MTWQIVVAMFIVIPIILLPVALVWWLNSGRIYAAIKEMRQRQVTRQREEREMTVAATEKQEN
jgi:hypothetical protein